MSWVGGRGRLVKSSRRGLGSESWNWTLKFGVRFVYFSSCMFEIDLSAFPFSFKRERDKD